jgi:hypothetical protein
MNQRDRDNLEFLLKSSPETLKDWFMRMDVEDHLYAKHIMNMYATELTERSTAAAIEVQLRAMSTFPEAMIVIDKVRRSAV